MTDKNKKDKIVITIRGEHLLKTECRYIMGNWYKIGNFKVINSGDCYLIAGKFYRAVNTSFITFDYAKKEYNLSRSCPHKVVIGVRKDVLIFGYASNITAFVQNPIIRAKDFKEYPSYIDISFFKRNRYYRESLSLGQVCYFRLMTVRELIEIRYINGEIKRSLPYNLFTAKEDPFKSTVKTDVDKLELIYKTIAKGMSDHSFGLEFETVKGIIPQRLLYKHNLVPLRDGSVEGVEYVTLPLRGASGVYDVVKNCNILQERTSYDASCSLHLHIGNLPRTEEFITAAFIASCYFQDYMYKLFPLYKQYNFNVKRKGYTKELPALNILRKLDPIITKDNISRNFAQIFKFLGGGVSYNDFCGANLDNITHHPLDPEGTRKWQVSPRYHWINFIPLIFTNKKTIEFRVHTPTFNSDKVIFFMLMNSLFLTFVENNIYRILEGRMNFKSSFRYRLTEELHSKGKVVNSITNKLSSYLEGRAKYSFEQNCRSAIHWKEQDFKVPLRAQMFVSTKKANTLSFEYPYIHYGTSIDTGELSAPPEPTVWHRMGYTPTDGALWRGTGTPSRARRELNVLSGSLDMAIREGMESSNQLGVDLGIPAPIQR